MLEVRRLQTLIAVINAEIKADLDQAMTLRQINTVNARKPVEVQGFSPDPISYDDLVEAQRRSVQTEAAISLRLEAILARGIALNAEKQPLLDRVKDLLGAPR